ncbi:tetratricopeptide repeat protein [Rugamonas sp.]|uniref:tetratricopeptide repeat protein n=1 Tax=Rugamonas sp. TaxID=1926287 RepID=UPI0025CC54C6|nr:tetratricopeptide repeat protein [Rugamonas sp.]
MISTSLIRATLLATAMTLAAPVFAAGADPSMHDVYLAAEAGKFTEAQAMMDQVLRDHPNSSKAHFVEAELLAKQGKISAAEAELNTADKLAPGLPGEKAGAVANLRQLIASFHATPAQTRSAYAPRPATVYTQPAPSHGSGMGGIVILVLLLVAFIVVVSRFMARRNPTTVAYGPTGMGGGGAGYGPGQPMQGGYAPGYGQPMQGGGIGSGIVGGLATGAAVGAGIVAGEALMHHFTDGDRDRGGYQPGYEPPPPVRDDRLANDDMGGNDFGANDSSSWDDNSGGGGGGGGGSDDW